MESIYLFSGFNKQAIDDKIKQIINAGNVSDLSLVKYDCEETVIDDILNDCETLPFLSDQKIVIMNQPLFLSTEKSKLDHNIDRFTKYINNPNESTILIINCCDIKLDRKKKIVKLLEEKAKHFHYDDLTEFEAQELIYRYFDQINVKIKNDAVNEIIRRTECDAYKINSELNKLSFYLEDLPEITIDDIKLLIGEPIEQNIFKLTEYFLARKIEDALRVYQQLILFNDPIVFLSILGKNFHNLYVVKQYQKQGCSEYQLKDILKIHPYQIKILYPIAMRTKEENISRNLQAFHEYDINVKTGRIDKTLGFELLILNM